MAGVTTYSEEMALIICERLADGESLKAICEDDDMPARSTVFKWLTESETFSDMYARAREEQADAIFDEILNIADDGRNDWMERRGEEDAGWVTNGENIQRAKLRIDARKWMAGKLRPKKYGEKLELEHGGQVTLTPTINFNANKG
ncbi:terminase small subunit protein [Agrobacterium radiobacter]|uniref:terminase small subunit-like protein n=1 Tax=Agrobacterium radiobacter TaxID=362 RepID=UPI0034659B00